MENVQRLVSTIALMILQLMTCQCRQIFYIRSTGSLFCPQNVSSLHCKDLDSFASERQLISVNTSLLFLSGYHYLDETVLISNIAEFLMAPYSGNIDGERIQITCSDYESGGISIDNVVHVRIDSIEFHSCGHNVNRRGNEVLILRSVQHSVITNSIWNKSRSSAIFMFNCSAVVLNCHMLETVCYHCKCGGVCTQQSNITLKGHNVISKNQVMSKGPSGGALRLLTSNLYLDGNLTIIGNTVKKGVGGMYMKYGYLFSSGNSSLHVSENKHIIFSKNSGGGLFLISVHTYLAGSTTITHNNVKRGGGGIHFVKCTCTITGFVLLHNNTAGKYGGGLHINNGEVAIDYAIFTDNSAQYGGGLSLINDAKLTVLKKATFNRNIATQKGGAIFAINSTINSFGSIRFENNSADLNGGAISLNEGTRAFFMNTEVAEFFGNSAKSGGGGLDVRSSSVLDNVAFAHNSAIDGGALNVALSSKCIFKRGSEAIFTNNRAKNSGGSINVFLLSIIIFHCPLNISDSHAGRTGGGIAITEAEIFLHGRTFLEDNKADTFGGALVLENSNLTFHGSSITTRNIAHYGGALHAMDSDIEFSGHHSFIRNFGQSGGGWSFTVNSYFTCFNVSDIVFDSNHASQHGGAMWI